MDEARLIQRMVDQLIYNQIYAPDFPEEDHTDLRREEARIKKWFEDAIRSTRREDVSGWLELGLSSTEAAFKKLGAGDSTAGRMEIESAIEYLRNAAKRKPNTATFISNPEGSVEPIPLSTEADSPEKGYH